MAWDSRHSSGRTRNARVGVLSSTGHAATAAAAAASTRAQAEQAAALVEIIRTKYRRDEVCVWRNDTGAASAWRRVGQPDRHTVTTDKDAVMSVVK